MKTARLLLLALAVASLGACQSNVLGPTAAETEGYAGSGSFSGATDAAPSTSEGYAGSGS